ncbi:putative peptidase domain-containing protein [Geopyxis carbonaria]|nr:putative peptidase domain-containing protein [Geopyxis carbonaria]
MVSFTLTAALALLAAAQGAVAAPTATATATAALNAPTKAPVIGAMDITIHASCNATQTRQLQAALSDTRELTQHALTHLLTHSTASPLFLKYFSSPHLNATTLPVVGLLSRLLHAPKPGVLLRCDDADGKCAANPSWAGHHRGAAAANETVICAPSFFTRRALRDMCARGYEITNEADKANGGRNLFWAGDLMHRLFHVPAVTEGAVEHWSEGGYEGVMEWLKGVGVEEQGMVGGNSDAVQYFALEAYALEVAAPGVGCLGTPREAAPVTASASASVSASASATVAPVASKVQAAGKECHTHAGGDIHCD